MISAGAAFQVCTTNATIILVKNTTPIFLPIP